MLEVTTRSPTAGNGPRRRHGYLGNGQGVIEMRAATDADVRAFYDGPPLYRVDACVALLDSLPVALGGIAYHPDAPGSVYAFMEVRDAMRPYRFSIGKFARRLAETFGGSELPGIAVAAPGEPAAGRLLRWLGFEHVTFCSAGEVYQWRN